MRLHTLFFFLHLNHNIPYYLWFLPTKELPVSQINLLILNSFRKLIGLSGLFFPPQLFRGESSGRELILRIS